MRHRKKGRKLNRTWSHRKSMLRNMVTTFLDAGQIETTDAKAKEVRSLAEKLVTVAKRGDTVAARRHVMKVVRDRKVVAKLFGEIAPRYSDRPGGYTRVLKMENRRGDGAQLSILQFVTEPVTFKEKKPRTGDDELAGPAVIGAAPAAPAEETAPEEPPAEETPVEEASEETAAEDEAEPDEQTEAAEEESAAEEPEPAEDDKKE